MPRAKANEYINVGLGWYTRPGVPSERESTPANRRAKARRLFAILGPILAVLALAAILAPRWARARGRDPAAANGAESARASASATPPPAGPAELALVAPIVVGSTSKGWKVEAIHAVHAGTITVTFAEQEGPGVLDLLVALSSEDGALPPATAGRYAVFYEARRAVPEDGERLAKVLARVLEKNQSAPTPPGLGLYVARPAPRQPL